MSDSYTDPTTHTSEQWRELAADARQRAADSFERSDTDGFLSQWASTSVASEYELCAKLAEEGGMATFTAVADLDGNLLNARNVETRYGWAWAIRNKDGSTSWFNESSARKGERRRKANEAKGYRLVSVRKRALVTFVGASYTSVRPIVVPADEREPGEVLGEIEYRDR